MRRVTRDFLLAMAVLAVLLLALGALPSYLRSGDPYYMTATTVGEANGTAADGTAGTPTATATANASTVDATTLSDRRYPYIIEALANVTADSAGRSTAYYRGPVGIKGVFSHSPFDEYDALAQQYSGAVDGDAVRVSHDGTVYRLAVTQQS